jgi:hypothetical protein
MELIINGINCGRGIRAPTNPSTGIGFDGYEPLLISPNSIENLLTLHLRRKRMQIQTMA